MTLIVYYVSSSGLISRFPLISALSASAVFFFILFIALAACLMPMVEWHFPSDGPHEFEPEDKAYRRRRSRHTERGRDDRVRKSRTPQTRSNRTSDSRPQTEVMNNCIQFSRNQVLTRVFVGGVLPPSEYHESRGGNRRTSTTLDTGRLSSKAC